MKHPEEFFAAKSEEVCIDPYNDAVLQPQLLAAAFELPLRMVRLHARLCVCDELIRISCCVSLPAPTLSLFLLRLLSRRRSLRMRVMRRCSLTASGAGTPSIAWCTRWQAAEALQKRSSAT